MPQLHLYRSNRVEMLLQPLLELMASPPADDPFVAEAVFVGSRGMQEWLRTRIARQLGICANVTFAFPGRVIALFGDEGARDDVFRPDVACWPLAELLADESEPVVQRYLSGGSRDEIDRLRYGLARQIADLLDRYGYHLPELVDRWAHATEPLPDDEAWQARVWTALQARAPEQTSTPQQRVRDGEVRSAELPSRLIFFGLSSLPTLLLNALGRLAENVDVHVLLLVPSPHFLDLRGPRHDPDRNPLASSFGRAAASMQAGLLALEERLGDRMIEDFGDNLFDDPAPRAQATLLSRLQSDLFYLRSALEIGPQVNDRGASVEVHACGSALRQVEALRDVIYEALDADPSLNPRDIVVMTPAIGDWYPLVSAVFEGGRGGAAALPAIPWRVLDLSMRLTNPVADTFLRVMRLAQARCTAAEVLDVLALDVVRDRYGLSTDDVDRVARRLEDVGLRWGLDAEHRAEHGLPRDDRYTWSDALDRLALSVVSPASTPAWRGIAADSDHTDEVDAIARFMAFTRMLFATVRDARRARPLLEWLSWLHGDANNPGLAERFVLLPDARSWYLRDVLADLEAVAESAAEFDVHTPVTAEAFRSWLEARFEVAAALEGDGIGSVTFGSFVPSRSIPYRLVCLLGMDEATFPRRTVPPRWDLTRRPRGDGSIPVPSPADDDRNLFLEAILAAREKLCVFYAARDSRTGLALPPCGPVAELVEMARAVLDQADGDRLTRHHPLMAFSPRNFAPDAALQSYDVDRLRAAVALGEPTGPLPMLVDAKWRWPIEAPYTLDCSRLAEILFDPSTTLVRRLLEGDFREYLDDVDDLLPVEPGDGLRQSMVAALAAFAHTTVITEVANELEARGSLPVTVDRSETAASRAALVEAAIRRRDQFRGSSNGEAVALTLAGDKLVLRDRIQPIHGTRLIPELSARESDRARLDTWVRLLSACVASKGEVFEAVRIGLPEGTGPVPTTTLRVPFETPERRLEWSQARLHNLFMIATESLERRVALVTGASSAFAQKLVDAGADLDGHLPDELLARARTAADTRWNGSGGPKGRPERSWENTAAVWGEATPYASVDAESGFNAEFEHFAIEVWGRLRAATTDETGGEGSSAQEET